MSTYSVYDIKIDNNLSFTPGPTAGYVLSINSDGTTSWVESGGGGGGGAYDVNLEISQRFISLTGTGSVSSIISGIIGNPVGLTVKSFVDPILTLRTGFNNTVYSIAIDSNDKIYVVGNFTSYNGTTANRIIRLNPDGSVDTDFVYGSGFSISYPRSIAIDSNGKIYVGGLFTSYNGTTANRIIRLNPDGSIDTGFVYGTGFNSDVWSITIDSNDKVYVGGNFTSYNGTSVNRIIRLNTDGSVDTGFVYGSGFNSIVISITIDSNGKIYVGGAYTTYNGTSANRIIRLNTDGSIDTGFVYGTGVDSFIYSIAIDSNGKIYVGGGYTTYNGTAANKIIRLNTDGSVDTGFVYGTGFNFTVVSITIDSNGKIYVGGAYTTYNGTSANRIIRLNTDGSVDTDFVYGSGVDNNINCFQPYTGGVYIGGDFTSYN